MCAIRYRIHRQWLYYHSEPHLLSSLYARSSYPVSRKSVWYTRSSIVNCRISLKEYSDFMFHLQYGASSMYMCELLCIRSLKLSSVSTELPRSCNTLWIPKWFCHIAFTIRHETKLLKILNYSLIALRGAQLYYSLVATANYELHLVQMLVSYYFYVDYDPSICLSSLDSIGWYLNRSFLGISMGFQTRIWGSRVMEWLSSVRRPYYGS